MEQKIIKILSQHTDSGTIVQLVQDNDGKQYVHKIIQHLDIPIYRTIFQKEIQALTRLKGCENIVRIFRSDIIKDEKGEEEGLVSMEYIPGKTLDKAIRDIPNISTRYYLVKQLTNAIRCAHQNSIIHRDINPSNILLTDDYNLKLIDFGFAKIRGMMQIGTTYQFATQNYSAPEVTIHSENATEQSDIYSLGAVIFYLFSGCIPFSSDKIIQQIMEASGLDVKLKEILSKMCASNPQDRYENIDDCEVALSVLYERYCGNDENYYFSVPSSILDLLKRKGIIRKNVNQDEFLGTYLPQHLTGGYIRKHIYRELDSDNDLIYIIDGIDISLECVLQNDVFHVTTINRLDAYKKEQHKRFSLELPGRFSFIPAYKIAYARLDNNYNQIVSNRVEDFQQDIRNQKNIDFEYNRQYGIWTTFIQAMIDDASKNAIRFFYKNVVQQDGLLVFRLESELALDGELSQETVFILEKVSDRKNKSLLFEVGTYFEYHADEKKLILKASPRKVEIPSSGSICLDYRKTIQQYRRQEAALESFVRSETMNTSNLKSVFVGIDEPNTYPLPHEIEYFNNQLDLTQKQAVKKILEADDIAIIQGPPGTGKTNVLVEVVRQILRENKRNSALHQRILIVSQSHAAVDNILEGLEDYLPKSTAIRIGAEDKIAEKVNNSFGLFHCQEYWSKDSSSSCKQHLEEQLNSKGIPLEEFWNYSEANEKNKLDNIQPEEKAKLEGILSKFEELYVPQCGIPFIQECLIMAQWAKHLNEHNELGEYYIKNATVVAGTCMGFISEPYIRNIAFDYAIIDEAAKATLPEIMVAMVRARKIVLVGDHKQLPPVFDRDAISRSLEDIQVLRLQEVGFGKLFELLPENCKETLSTQYRMHPAIGDLVSTLFYNGKVQNGVSAMDRSIELKLLKDNAITWISTTSSGRNRYEQFASVESKSFINVCEINIILSLLEKLAKEMKETTVSYSIGIITPYRAQLEMIKSRLSSIHIENLNPDVNTVDAFQGNQRDIIIYSTVRSNAKNQIGFLREEARLNVSFSRAKRALIIVGDDQFLGSSKISGNLFPDILRYINDHSEFCKLIDVKELT